jgi:hypothetical protein
MRYRSSTAHWPGSACVFVPAKTVADCFKYRNKVGLDVAIRPDLYA